jgi:hypothetical protein
VKILPKYKNLRKEENEMDSKRYFIYVKRIGSKQYTHTKESFTNFEEAKSKLKHIKPKASIKR